MLRSTDTRCGVGEAALLAETLAAGDLVLAHGELISLVVPHPQPNEDEDILFADIVVGQLVVISIDDREIHVRLDEPYTLHESEDVTQIAPDNDLNVLDALSRAPAPVDSWFVQQERLIDLIDGRNVIVDSASVVQYPWPIPGAVTDTSTPTVTLSDELSTWFVNQGFTAASMQESFRKRIDDTTELVAAIAPQSFRAENPCRRHPITVHLGLAHREANQMCDWLSGHQARPWRWSIQEHAAYFAPNVPWAWAAETPATTVTSALGRALDELHRFSSEPDRLGAYLWTKTNPTHAQLYQRMRLTWDLLQGWSNRSEADLAEWKSTTTSRNLTTTFETTLRRYQDTGNKPYWMD